MHQSTPTVLLLAMLCATSSSFLIDHQLIDNKFYSPDWNIYIYNGNLDTSRYYYNFHYMYT